MIRLILFFIIIAIFSTAALWFAENDGSLTMEWLGWRIDTTINFLLLAISLIFTILLAIIEILLFIKRIPRCVSVNRASSLNDRAICVLADGFAALSAADTKNARRCANETSRILKNKPIAHILEAHTAQLEGDTKLSKKHFTALLDNKGTDFAGIKGLFSIASEDGNINEALELAQKIYNKSPLATGAAIGLLKLYKQTGKWSEALLFLEKHAKKSRRFFTSKEESTLDIEREKSLVTFVLAQKSLQKGNTEKAFELSLKAHKLYPAFVPATIMSANLFIEQGKKNKAASLCEQSWKKSPNPEIAKIYFSIYENEKESKKLKRALKLLSLCPDNFESHKIVAQMSIKAEDFTKARNHIKLAMNYGETKSLCSLMVEVEKNDIAERKVWEARIVHAQEDSSWTCSSCSALHDDWKISCFECNSVDSIMWQ